MPNEKESIMEILQKQLNNFFVNVNVRKIDMHIDSALLRCKECFSKVNSKYICESKHQCINPSNSVQWSVFLYYLSTTLNNVGGEYAAEVYYLNKIMNGVDWFYAIELPQHFYAEHPVGSVLGRAQYGDYFFVYQGITVGGNTNAESGKTEYPIIGNYVIMFSDSKIIGNAVVGNNVLISANAYIKDEIIPDNTIVFGASPNITIKKMNSDNIMHHINKLWL